jgi:hypothetical protein
MLKEKNNFNTEINLVIEFFAIVRFSRRSFADSDSFKSTGRRSVSRRRFDGDDAQYPKGYISTN